MLGLYLDKVYLGYSPILILLLRLSELLFGGEHGIFSHRNILILVEYLQISLQYTQSNIVLSLFYIEVVLFKGKGSTLYLQIEFVPLIQRHRGIDPHTIGQGRLIDPIVSNLIDYRTMIGISRNICTDRRQPVVLGLI